jgi:hypothetical protein
MNGFTGDYLISRMEAFGDEFAWLAKTAEQRKFATSFNRFVEDAGAVVARDLRLTRHLAEALDGLVSATPIFLTTGATYPAALAKAEAALAAARGCEDQSRDGTELVIGRGGRK